MLSPLSSSLSRLVSLAPLLVGCLSSTPGARAAGSYNISVSPVLEVCLRGSASPDYWAKVLAPEGLKLAGEAPQVALCGTEARFGGREFGEATLGVAVEAGKGQGLFLLRALNNVRAYAWTEVNKNRSPYSLAEVEVEASSRKTQLVLGLEGAILRAALAVPIPVTEVPTELRSFEGSVYLPGRASFPAHLEGDGATRPFSSGDRFEVGQRGVDPLSDALNDMAFVPATWWVCPDGRHEKGNTVGR